MPRRLVGWVGPVALLVGGVGCLAVPPPSTTADDAGGDAGGDGGGDGGGDCPGQVVFAEAFAAGEELGPGWDVPHMSGGGAAVPRDGRS